MSKVYEVEKMAVATLQDYLKTLENTCVDIIREEDVVMQNVKAEK